jgi:hypothetical protein
LRSNVAAKGESADIFITVSAGAVTLDDLSEEDLAEKSKKAAFI